MLDSFNTLSKVYEKYMHDWFTIDWIFCYLKEIVKDFLPIIEVYVDNITQRLFVNSQKPTQLTDPDGRRLRNVAKDGNLSESAIRFKNWNCLFWPMFSNAYLLLLKKQHCNRYAQTGWTQIGVAWICSALKE